MKILLDTHILVWFHTHDDALPQEAWDILLNPQNEIFYSSVNIWETQMKFLKHADDINFSGDELNDLSIKAGLQSLPVKPNHCIELKSLVYSEDAPHNVATALGLILVHVENSHTFLLNYVF